MVTRFFLRATLVTIACASVLVVPGCLADKRTLSLDGASDGATGDGGSGDGGGGACSPSKQTGCTANEKCTLDRQDRPICVANGTKATRTSCSGEPDNCVRGNFCAGLGGTAGVCRQFCDRNDDCTQPPPSGQPSNEAFCAFDFPNTPYRLCSTPCNPVPRLGPSGCPAGVACLYGNLGGTLITDCNRPAGSGRDGAACSTAEDCADGYLCASSRCRAYCRNGFDADCAGAGYFCGPAGAGATFSVCCPSSGC